MQKHKNEKIENAIFVGIIVVLLVTLTSMIRHDFTAKVVDNKSLSLANNFDFFWKAAIITMGSLVFILFALSSLFSNGNALKEEENLKDFVFQCKHRGYSKVEIIEILSIHGFYKEDIDKYF